MSFSVYLQVFFIELEMSTLKFINCILNYYSKTNQNSPKNRTFTTSNSYKGHLRQVIVIKYTQGLIIVN